MTTARKTIESLGYDYSKIPFKGMHILDSEPAKVTNPISGRDIELNPVELAVYDVTMGSYHVGLYDDFYKGRDWFLENNIEAYMVLID